MQFFGCAMLSLVDELKQILLQCLPCDIRNGQFSENGQQIGGTQPFIFFAGTFLARLALDFQPFVQIIGKASVGMNRCRRFLSFRTCGQRHFAVHLFQQFGNKFFAHLVKILCAGEHFESVSAVMRFVHSFMKAVRNDPVFAGKYFTVFLRHTFDLLFR